MRSVRVRAAIAAESTSGVEQWGNSSREGCSTLQKRSKPTASAKTACSIASLSACCSFPGVQGRGTGISAKSANFIGRGSEPDRERREAAEELGAQAHGALLDDLVLGDAREELLE